MRSGFVTSLRRLSSSRLDSCAPKCATSASRQRARSSSVPRVLISSDSAGAMPSSRHSRAESRISSHSTVRTRLAVDLGAGLVELALAPQLRALVAEHRPRVPDPRPAGALGQPALDGGAHAPGGVLRAQRDALALPVLEGVHLLLDDVGGLADRALEQRGALDQRGAHLGVAVGGRGAPQRRLERVPRTHVGRQQVDHAAQPRRDGGRAHERGSVDRDRYSPASREAGKSPSSALA